MMGHFLAWISDLRDSEGFLSKVSPNTKKLAEKFVPVLSTALDSIFAGATRLSRKESTDFFSGVAFAMARTFDENEPHLRFTDATGIYAILALLPDVIVTKQSVPELH